MLLQREQFYTRTFYVTKANLKGMDTSSVQALTSHFTTKVNNIKTCLVIRNSVQDEDVMHVMRSLQKDVHEMEALMALLRAAIEKEREKLTRAEMLKGQVQALSDKVNYTVTNLPARLPKTVQPQTMSTESVPQTPMPLSRKTNPNVDSSVSKTKKKASSSTYYPTLQYVTTEEFVAVPKYIKGRLAYDTLNSAIDEFNKSVAGKYKVLGQPKKALLKSGSLQDKVNAYKLQETKDTKGLYFITDGDMKAFSSLKMDATTRTILTILRHCGRLREVRGGNLTRYVLCG